MKRNKTSAKSKLNVFQRIISEAMNRLDLARKLGYQYGKDRKVYEALGYPEEKELDFKWYWNKYDRQDIAAAIIDRPVDATWNGALTLVEEDKKIEDSELSKAWGELNKRLKVKKRLNKVDKLAGIHRYSLLLFGFRDVKKKEDWKVPVTGSNNELLYLKQISESSVTIKDWETNSNNERFGLPKFYRIKIGQPGDDTQGQSEEIMVHHSRVLHVSGDSLTSEVFGVPRLKPVVNRLVDLEKILGGDAEMFWRGARPGYHATGKEGFEFGDTEIEQLEKELDKYEHDLRRFIVASGTDIKALEQQIEDPLNHIDAQLQAIAAKTGIPKRILIGSERGELASSQDMDQWLTLVKTRMEEEAEPDILRPFVDKCMELGVLPMVERYNVVWEDVFAPSEKQKAEVGKERAQALKAYADSLTASDLLPPVVAYKVLLGLDDEQVQEIQNAVQEQEQEEAAAFRQQGVDIDTDLNGQQINEPVNENE